MVGVGLFLSRVRAWRLVLFFLLVRRLCRVGRAGGATHAKRACWTLRAPVMKRAEKVREVPAREMITWPSSNGYRCDHHIPDDGMKGLSGEILEQCPWPLYC